MTIDVFADEVLSLAEACKRLPRIRDGKKISTSTVWRWATAGLKADDGTRVRLEVVKIGGLICTSREALQRFFDRLKAPVPVPLPIQTPRSLREREKAVRAADRALRMGGMDGDGIIFERSTVSGERLCDLHEFLHEWMPSSSHPLPQVFFVVRSGIFAQAVKILEGKVGSSRSMAAAKQWILDLDLTSLDVQTLDGVGPFYAKQWAELRESPVIKSMIQDQHRRGEKADGE